MTSSASHKLELALALLLALWAGPLAAQAIGTPQPLPVAPVDASSTITTTNTFQQVFAAPSQSTAFPQLRYRAGCLIINTSTHTQWVFFGTLALATTPTSVPLNAATSQGLRGGSTSCVEDTVGVLQGQISITGTAGDTFMARQE